MTKGFITVATGKEEYYRLASNLLHSYHYFCDEPLPFAVLTDQSNQWTDQFDWTILFEDGATNSYLDKLSLAEYLPFDINIFIDSDCLAYGDLNRLFEHFEDADDFSCFGRVLPLDDTTGWFEYKNIGELKDRVSYVIGLHGGIYYMRKGPVCNRIMNDAKSFIPDYNKYKFKGNFTNPGDEPLVALAMAVNGCKPIPFIPSAICCYWEYVDLLKLDISKGIAKIECESEAGIDLIHWGTRFTRELVYQKQVALLEIMESSFPNKDVLMKRCQKQYDARIAAKKREELILRAVNKVKRMIGIK